MPFQFSFRVDPERITVPYALITDDIRRNRGFVDLRGHPNKAKDIGGKRLPSVTESVGSRCERRIGTERRQSIRDRRELKERTVDATRAALEKAGVEFEGKKPREDRPD